MHLEVRGNVRQLLLYDHSLDTGEPDMKRILALVLVLAAFTAACGSDEATGGDQPSSTEATTTEATTTEATTTEATTTETPTTASAADTPSAIISLNPSATEMLFAVGAGDQVVAVDDFSYYPPEAPVTDLSGFAPNIESIAAYEPDLVVLPDPGIEADLEALGIPTLVLNAAVTIDDTYTQIEQVGAATGHVGEAAELVLQMQTDIAEVVAATPIGDASLTYFHEIDNTLYTSTSATFIGDVYALFGLENIGDPADADGSNFGYPQLSEEFLFEADPALIFLSDTAYGESIETVGARPGWDALAAVQNGGVIELDSDIASRWGPRIVDLVRSISEAIQTVSVAA